MNVKTLISILQKEVKPADRENANIEIWCGDQEYDIESMNGFSFSPDIVIKLEKTVTPALQPLKFKNEHKEKVRCRVVNTYAVKLLSSIPEIKIKGFLPKSHLSYDQKRKLNAY